LPPKKAVGNLGEEFVEDRRYFLERFLAKIGEFDFLLNCEELNTFARSFGDIDKSL
jgi:hypothetical protein